MTPAALSLPSVLLALALLTATACTVTAALRLERPWLQAWSLARAVLQLGALSLVLAFLLVMVGAAATVVASRMEWGSGAASAPQE
jgi:hypothetical protein